MCGRACPSRGVVPQRHAFITTAWRRASDALRIKAHEKPKTEKKHKRNATRRNKQKGDIWKRSAKNKKNTELCMHGKQNQEDVSTRRVKQQDGLKSLMTAPGAPRSIASQRTRRTSSHIQGSVTSPPAHEQHIYLHYALSTHSLIRLHGPDRLHGKSANSCKGCLASCSQHCGQPPGASWRVLPAAP